MTSMEFCWGEGTGLTTSGGKGAWEGKGQWGGKEERLPWHSQSHLHTPVHSGKRTQILESVLRESVCVCVGVECVCSRVGGYKMDICMCGGRTHLLSV